MPAHRAAVHVLSGLSVSLSSDPAQSRQAQRKRSRKHLVQCWGRRKSPRSCQQGTPGWGEMLGSQSLSASGRPAAAGASGMCCWRQPRTAEGGQGGGQGEATGRTHLCYPHSQQPRGGRREKQTKANGEDRELQVRYQVTLGCPRARGCASLEPTALPRDCRSASWDALPGPGSQRWDGGPGPGLPITNPALGSLHPGRLQPPQAAQTSPPSQ